MQGIVVTATLTAQPPSGLSDHSGQCSVLSSAAPRRISSWKHTFKCSSAGSKTQTHSIKDKLKPVPKSTWKLPREKTYQREDLKVSLILPICACDREKCFLSYNLTFGKKMAKWDPFLSTFTLCHRSINLIKGILIYANWWSAPHDGNSHLYS